MLPNDPSKVIGYKQKLSDAKSGANNPNYGKTTWNKGLPAWNRGKKWTNSVKQNISNALKGRTFTEPHKKKLKQRPQCTVNNYFRTHKFIGKDNWNYGNKIPEWQKQIIREARAKQIFPVKDTKPERMMQLALQLNGIKFEKHKLFINGKFFHRVDIFIEPKYCIEVDGTYWHTKPEVAQRDSVINHELGKLGMFVLRIWDKDVLKNTQGCAEKIISTIQKLRDFEGFHKGVMM